MQVRTRRALPVQGRPAWHGQFSFSRPNKWTTVKNKAGRPIVYSKRIFALLAAVQQLYIQHGEEDET